MQAPTENVFIGVWRSFKVSKRTGAITLYTDKRFKEFNLYLAGNLLSLTTKRTLKNLPIQIKGLLV